MITNTLHDTEAETTYGEFMQLQQSRSFSNVSGGRQEVAIVIGVRQRLEGVVTERLLVRVVVRRMAASRRSTAAADRRPVFAAARRPLVHELDAEPRRRRVPAAVSVVRGRRRRRGAVCRRHDVSGGHRDDPDRGSDVKPRYAASAVLGRQRRRRTVLLRKSFGRRLHGIDTSYKNNTQPRTIAGRKRIKSE